VPSRAPCPTCAADDSSDDDDDEEGRQERAALQRCYITQHQLLAALALKYPPLLSLHGAHAHFMQLLLADDLQGLWSLSRCDGVMAALLDTARRQPGATLGEAWRGDLVALLVRVGAPCRPCRRRCCCRCCPPPLLLLGHPSIRLHPPAA
jgi:hypothetical protein